MVVLNKSNDGLGLSCHHHPSLVIGEQLNLFNLVICRNLLWIQKLWYALSILD